MTPSSDDPKPQRFVLCEKCRLPTVVKVDDHPPGEIALSCTSCSHRWAIKDYTPPVPS